ncbi:MAG: TetR family transcriptional regulator [Anaerolineae bacterium]
MAQNTGEAEDLRVRRTRKMLAAGIDRPDRRKGFNTITVRDITERAMVNRSTFYRHYSTSTICSISTWMKSMS